MATILRVNLTNRTMTKEPLDPELAKQYIGARGLGTQIMYDEVDPKVDPLSPDNKLIFAPGPLSGTYAPSAGRFNVVTKGPLTGTIAASSSGGVFGPELKYAGYDLIIVEGKADKPVYLWIRDDKVEIRDAGNIWGKEVPDTTDAIRAETDEDAKVACIGPGRREDGALRQRHERDAPGGGTDRRRRRDGVEEPQGGRGPGAAARSGSPIRKGFKAAVMKAREKILNHPVGGRGLKAYGTDVLINIMNESGGLPTRNFREGVFATADKVGGESLTKNLLPGPGAASPASSAAAGRPRSRTRNTPGSGEGPEYETAWSFGPDCGIDDLDAVTKAHYLCNE